MKFLPFPKEFDQNEWFIIICLVLLVFILKKLPKRFPTSITILLLIFTMSVSRIVDHLLAGPHINFYDIMDTGKYEFFDLFAYVPYAPFGYVFIYIYDKYQIEGIRLILYIVVSSLGSIAIEGLTTTTYIDFFKYIDWKIIYSLPIYLFILPCTLLFYHFIKNTHAKLRLTTEIDCKN